MKRLFYTFVLTLMTITASAQKPVEVELIAHRGGRYEFEENVLSAFVGSYKKGVRSYETDVRLTADNHIVISHDASLKRVFGIDVVVEKSLRADLAQYRSKKGNPVLFADELAEFFSHKDIHYVEWEMKSNDYAPEQLEIYCDKLYKTVMAAKPKNAVYIFSSFDERAILTMKRLYPNAECALITREPMSDSLIAHLKELGFKRVACRVEGTSRKAMVAAHKEGLIVNLWPGKCVEDFQLAVALGADIACTDIPVEVLTAIKKRMPWITPAKDIR